MIKFTVIIDTIDKDSDNPKLRFALEPLGVDPSRLEAVAANLVHSAIEIACNLAAQKLGSASSMHEGKPGSPAAGLAAELIRAHSRPPQS